MKTTKQILIKAASIIERDGLHKGGFQASTSGACCTAGAIYKADTGDAYDYSKASTRAADKLRALLGGSIVDFNDHPSTLRDEVIQVLPEAAHAS